MPGRRWKKLLVGRWFFETLLHGWQLSKVSSDAPEDARVVHGWWDQDRGQMVLVVESATFDEVDEGTLLPDWWPSFTTYTPDFAALLEILSDKDPTTGP